MFQYGVHHGEYMAQGIFILQNEAQHFGAVPYLPEGRAVPFERLARVVPVSYTHLDVYKRQLLISLSTVRARDGVPFLF